MGNTIEKQRCTTCILTEDYPKITFDEKGECNYCRKWKKVWKDIDFSQQSIKLEGILNKFKGKSKPYDCLLGLSGGKDSCYAAYVLKDMGMNPLACTYDNGFMTDVAMSNIKNTVESLSLGHVLIKHDRDYLLKLYKHFVMTSGEFCSVCNVGIRSALYRVAKNFKLKLIVSGQSTRTEANSPQEFFSCSSGYFCNVSKNLMDKKEADSFVYVSQIKRAIDHVLGSSYYLQLPSFIPWREEIFIELIKDKLNWKGAFGEQHTDCQMSDAKEFLKLKQFHLTELTAKVSSLIRDSQINRKEALEKTKQHIDYLLDKEDLIIEHIMSVLDMTRDEVKKSARLSHTPFIAKSDMLLSDLKKSIRSQG